MVSLCQLALVQGGSRANQSQRQYREVAPMGLRYEESEKVRLESSLSVSWWCALSTVLCWQITLHAET